MSLIGVWSERRPGAWVQCTECAYLMAMAYGDFEAFPLGQNTDAERDALDEASGYPNDIGSTYDALDQGAMARYGVALRTIPRAALSYHLSLPGRALAIAGSYSKLPYGHPMRRWQPGFIGGHAVTVVVTDNGLLWMDPLAPKGHPGDKVSAADVLAFASGWSGWSPREALAGELRVTVEDDMSTDFSATTYQQPKFIWLRKGAAIYTDERGSTDASGENLMGHLVADTEFFMPGWTVGQTHIVSRVDRDGPPVWIYQDAIIPSGEDPLRPFRRLYPATGADEKLAKIKAIANS